MAGIYQRFPPVNKSALRDAIRRLRAYPSEANARALATVLAEQPTADDGPLEVIEIQVWSTTYDPVTTAPHERMLRSFRLARGEL